MTKSHAQGLNTVMQIKARRKASMMKTPGGPLGGAPTLIMVTCLVEHTKTRT